MRRYRKLALGASLLALLVGACRRVRTALLARPEVLSARQG